MGTIRQIAYEECVGCGSCMNVCPVDCISMQYDEEGFLFPRINIETCIECGKCLKACPVFRKIDPKGIKKIYGGYINDVAVAQKSSSGGAFWCLASAMITRGGVVFGATIDCETGHVYHKSVHSLDELESITRSKYVQSEIGNTYSEISKLLNQGKPVLFCGTPCQVAGLKAFLGKAEFQNQLITVEFICHGVPSPCVWEEYIKHLKSEGIEPICDINFRDKRNGWHNFGLSIKYGTNGYLDRFRTVRNDNYYNGFIENLFLRKSCYKCKFKGLGSLADISLADFWNCENRGVSEKLKSRQLEGISLIMVFSSQGLLYIEKCINEFYLEVVQDVKSITTNVAQIKSPEYNKRRRAFYYLRSTKGTMIALQKYGRYTLKKRILNKMKWKLWSLLGFYK